MLFLHVLDCCATSICELLTLVDSSLLIKAHGAAIEMISMLQSICAFFDVVASDWSKILTDLTFHYSFVDRSHICDHGRSYKLFSLLICDCDASSKKHLLTIKLFESRRL